jgi:hypothetical protein
MTLERRKARDDFINSLTINDGGSAAIPRTATLNLFRRSYWSRVWIIQELASAKDVLFTCGSFFMDYVYFEVAMMPIAYLRTVTQIAREDGDDRQDFVHEMPTGPSSIIGWRLEALMHDEPGDYGRFTRLEHVRQGKLSQLLRMLRQAQVAGFGATDPRDRIYAFLNTARDSNTFNITVDYSKSCSEVYIQFTRAALRRGDVLILNMVEHTSQLQLPSWVADWSAKQITPVCLPLIQYEPPFRASGSTNSIVDLNPTASDNVILVSSFAVDQVETILPISLKMELGIDLEPDISSHMNFLETLETLLNDHYIKCNGIYATMEARKEAVWRTPIFDHESSLFEPVKHLAGDTSRQQFEILRGRVSAPPGESEYRWRREASSAYWQTFEGIVQERVAFVTQRGYLGLGPKDMQTGDLVHIFKGLNLPVILRSRATGSKGIYQLLGSAYVHGIMYGEFLNPEIVNTTVLLA